MIDTTQMVPVQHNISICIRVKISEEIVANNVCIVKTGKRRGRHYWNFCNFWHFRPFGGNIRLRCFTGNEKSHASRNRGLLSGTHPTFLL